MCFSTEWPKATFRGAVTRSVSLLLALDTHGACQQRKCEEKEREERATPPFWTLQKKVRQPLQAPREQQTPFSRLPKSVLTETVK